MTGLQPTKSSFKMEQQQPIGSTATRYQRVTPAQMKKLNEVRMVSYINKRCES